MANIISFDDGACMDLDTFIGCYEYIARVLRDAGAPSNVFSALERLFPGKFFAVTYEDDGPTGCGPQTVSATAPWKKLYVFHDEDKMLAFCKKVETFRGRRNPRITMVFYPQLFSDSDIVVMD